MDENKLNYVDVACMTEEQATEWANKNEGTFAFGDNGGVIQAYVAHFYEEGKRPKPQDVGFIISMCDELSMDETQIIITDFAEMKRLRDYLDKVIVKYEEAKMNDIDNPCYKCVGYHSCNNPRKDRQRCKKYTKCPF